MTLPTGRPRGRPRVDTPKPKDGAIVSAWVTTQEYDTICKTATQYDMTISQLVRLWLQFRIKSS